MFILTVTDQNYLFQTGVMLKSLMSNHKNENLIIFLFHWNTNAKDVEKLASYIRKYGHILQSYQLDDSDFCKIGADRYFTDITRTDHLTLATYGRLLVETKLPQDCDRVLYLDSDIIIRKNLTNLYNSQLLDDETSALVVEGESFKDYDFLLFSSGSRIKADSIKRYAQQFRKKAGLSNESKYFNAGVLLINLGYFRKKNMQKAFRTYIVNEKEYIDGDQIVLNEVLKDSVKYVPFLYNIRPNNYCTLHKKFLCKNACIIHYGKKPWNRLKVHLGFLWWKCAFKYDFIKSFKLLYSVFLDYCNIRGGNV